MTKGKSTDLECRKGTLAHFSVLKSQRELSPPSSDKLKEPHLPNTSDGVAMNDRFDKSKTLDELDPPAWSKPAFDSYLLGTCYRLRKKPVGAFTVEDLRIMIGQRIGLRWLVPLALDVLEREPLAQGDFYPGDLLTNVLKLDEVLWRTEPEWLRRIQRVLSSLSGPDEVVSEAVAGFRQRTT